MNSVLDVRQKIYGHFHASSACQTYFYSAAREDAYAAYYTSMYLLQDTTESLWHHRRRGFSGDPMDAYIELWGILQATTIQQDAAVTLHGAVIGSPLSTSSFKNWAAVRQLRVICAGHPANQGRGGDRRRAFLGRTFGSYSAVTYELWDARSRKSSHPSVQFGLLLDGYADELATALGGVLEFMRATWPTPPRSLAIDSELDGA